MRFNEEMNEERSKEEDKKNKTKKKEEKRILAGDKDYDYYELGSNKPMLGGNPWS